MKIKILFIGILLLTSCAPLKISKLFKSGVVQKGDFFESISCQPKGTLMIVDVIVNGESAKFLFDTGAPNVISPELATKLNLKTKTTVKVKDSGGNKESQECVMLDTLTLGGVHFFDVGAIIVNLQANDVIECLGVDGIFGANSMRHAFWELDVENKNISLTNDISNLADTSQFTKLKFHPVRSGTPKIKLSLNGHPIENVTFDTGSGGHLKVPKSDYQKVKSNTSDLAVVSAVGTTSYGVYGLAKADTSHYGLIDSIQIGQSIVEENIVVEFNGPTKLLGTKWMDNYTLILDWNSNFIYVKETSPYTRSSFKNYGFGLNFNDRKMLVGSLFLESEAASKLQIGDQILQVDEDNYENLPDIEYCSAMFRKSFSEEYGDEISLKIKRGEEILIIRLKKENRF